MFLVRIISILFVALMSIILLGGIASDNNLGYLSANSLINVNHKQSDSKILAIDLLPTYGPFGSTRQASLIAGEKLHMALTVSGLSAGANGKVDYTISTYLQDSQKKPVSEPSKENINGNLCLGGSSSIHSLTIPFGRDVPAGKYYAYIEVFDHVSKQKQAKEFPFDVSLKSTYGILDLKLSHDSNGTIPFGGNITVGEIFYVSGMIGGAKNNNGKYHVVTTLSFYDGDNHLLPEALTYDYDKDHPTETDLLIPFFYQIPAHRPGKYVLHIEVNDVIAGSKETYDIPINILLPPSKLIPVKQDHHNNESTYNESSYL